MNGRRLTVDGALAVLENGSNQAGLFVMRHPETGEEVHGIDGPFFHGFSIPARTALALFRRGYAAREYRWDP